MKWRYRILIAGAVLGTGVIVVAALGAPPLVVWQVQRALKTAGFPEAAITGLHLGLSGATIARFDLSPRVHASTIAVDWHLGGLITGHVDRVTIGEVQINGQWAQGRLDLGRREPSVLAATTAGGGGGEAGAPLPCDHLAIDRAVIAVSGDGWKVEAIGQASADLTANDRLAIALTATLPGANLRADGTIDPQRLTGDGAWHGDGDLGELAHWLPTVAAAVMPAAGIAPLGAPADLQADAQIGGAHADALLIAGQTLIAPHGAYAVDGAVRIGADSGGLDATFTAHDLGASLPIPGLPRQFGTAGDVDAGCAALTGACDWQWGAGAQSPRIDLQAKSASLSSSIWGLRVACPHLHVDLAGGTIHGDGRAEVLGAIADASGERDADGGWRASATLSALDLAAWQARVRPWLDLPMTLSGTAALHADGNGGADGACAATADLTVSGLAVEAPFGTAVLKFAAPAITGHGQAHRAADGTIAAYVVPGFTNGHLDIPAFQLQIPDLAATVPCAIGVDPGLSGSWRAGPWSCLGHALPAAQGTVAVVGHGVTADAATTFTGLALRGAIAIPGDGSLHAHAAIDPAVISDITAFLPFVPQLDGWTGSARISAAATADFAAGAWQQHLDVSIDDGHVANAAQNLDITGIKTTAALTSLTPLSATVTSLHVAHVKIGPQAFDHIEGSAKLAYPAIDLTDAGWAWGDGRFTAAAMHADLSTQIAGGTVAVDHLDIARVVSLFAAGRVTASGRLAGNLENLQIHWNPLRVHWSGGSLHGEGGKVQIIDQALLTQVAEPVVANLSRSADNLGPAAASMRAQVRKKVYDGFADFIYTALGASIAANENGDLTTVTIAGQGENGLPIRSLTLNITGLADGINSALALQGMPAPSGPPPPSQDDMNAFFGP